MVIWTECFNNTELKQEWSGKIPDTAYKGIEKIKDKRYEDLMLKVFKKNMNSYTYPKIAIKIHVMHTTLIYIFVALWLSIISKSSFILSVVSYSYIIYTSLIIYKLYTFKGVINQCFTDEYLKYFMPKFVKVKKVKKNVFHYSNNMADDFVDSIKHPENKEKLCLFNYITQVGDFIKHNEEKL